MQVVTLRLGFVRGAQRERRQLYWWLKKHTGDMAHSVAFPNLVVQRGYYEQMVKGD